MYAYQLPNATLSNLMVGSFFYLMFYLALNWGSSAHQNLTMQDIFVSLSTVDDSLYFMCNVDDFKFLADMIQHVPLPLRARYVFCCAPINRKMPFVCAMFLKVTIIIFTITFQYWNRDGLKLFQLILLVCSAVQQK